MKKKKTTEEIKNTTAWPFELDQLPAFTWDANFLTNEECDKLIALGKKLESKAGRIGGDAGHELKKNDKKRKSDIAWILPGEEVVWLYRRLCDGIKSLNHEYFHFDIFGACESIQFTHYKAPDGHYGAHMDRGTGIVVRKLSVSIQLSDPEAYEGGDLVLYESGAATKLPRKRGMLILFPSWYVHEVTPVTKGERFSLVCWITGKPFK